MPEHPTALSLLAQLASPDEDPRAFADAKLREAEHAKDEDVKIAALMAAGAALATVAITPPRARSSACSRCARTTPTRRGRSPACPRRAAIPRPRSGCSSTSSRTRR